MIEEEYTKKIEHYTQRVSLQKRNLNHIMWARVGAFLSIILVIVLAISFSVLQVLWGVIAPLLVFGFLVKKNDSEKKILSLLENLLLINKEEINSLNGDYSTFDDGKPFVDSQHPYSHDLDLFGKKSLFQFLNRTSSQFAQKELARYLTQFETNFETIEERQIATTELAKKLEWRQLFQAKGKMNPINNSELESLFTWKKEEIPFFNNLLLWKFISWGIPSIMILGTILGGLSIIPSSLFLLMLLIPFSFLAKKLKTIGDQVKKLSSYLDMLIQQQELTSLIENESFESKLLTNLQNNLNSHNSSASSEIKRLAKIGQQLDNRNNAIFALVMNVLFLWDLQYLFQLKTWLEKNENSVKGWFSVVFETEALASFGNFNYNHPQFSFPVLSHTEVISATDLGHPLLPQNIRVTSDFELKNLQKFTIITGANMAGKSTFLRAMGINLILATCGAKVCSSHFVFKPIPLFSSMRTTDSLSENESYFYSELKRLQMIVNRLKNGEELFVILDEILKGTNSKDKAEGSKKFVAQLIKYPVAGIIATHDLSLCSLKEEFPRNIKNQYFDVELENDQLVFDYKLKQGICSNMNAAFLMKKMGITE